MERNISSYVLKISNGAELSSALEDDKVVSIKHAELTIYDISDKNNEDGTYTRSYKARITSEIELEQDLKAIRGRDKSKKSIRLRQAIWSIGRLEGASDDERFYEDFMNKLLLNIEEVNSFLKS